MPTRATFSNDGCTDDAGIKDLARFFMEYQILREHVLACAEWGAGAAVPE